MAKYEEAQKILAAAEEKKKTVPQEPIVATPDKSPFKDS